MKEEKGEKHIEDFLPKEGRGLRDQIMDEGKEYKPSSARITQKDFEEMIYACAELQSKPQDDFIIGTQAGLFKLDKYGDWFCFVKDESKNIRQGEFPDNWKRCLSPFLEDGRPETRSEVIFIKEGE